MAPARNQQRSLAAVAVVLGAVVATAGVAGAVAFSSDANGAAESGDGRTVEVGASGAVEADPDQAVLRVAVVARSPDVAAARQQLADNVSAMRSALADAGVADDQIRTAHYDIGEDHRPENREREYRAIHAFEITLSDVDRVGPVIDTAVANGADRVDGVEFTLSEDRRRQLRRQALDDAMDNARAQADTIAGKAGLSITGVHAASTVDVDARPYRTEAAMAGDAGGTAIESGPVTVTAQVQVVYNASG
jgi:uncharacterized protein YggE